ncbi:hypothetical protein IEQ34_008084 [Dendrobium chrysotoxum]|uniref:Uncharacterized protein n=1 Tax=Dendrobium chrysotoxum TaxID=161865 RepID=A0AAV7H6H8_DENCH|nr:hypothetical protein IEQ34_008084 [Dendrobium chrysotoxum]
MTNNIAFNILHEKFMTSTKKVISYNKNQSQGEYTFILNNQTNLHSSLIIPTLRHGNSSRTPNRSHLHLLRLPPSKITVINPQLRGPGNRQRLMRQNLHHLLNHTIHFLIHIISNPINRFSYNLTSRKKPIFFVNNVPNTGFHKARASQAVPEVVRRRRRPHPVSPVD